MHIMISTAEQAIKPLKMSCLSNRFYSYFVFQCLVFLCADTPPVQIMQPEPPDQQDDQDDEELTQVMYTEDGQAVRPYPPYEAILASEPDLSRKPNKSAMKGRSSGGSAPLSPPPPFPGSIASSSLSRPLETSPSHSPHASSPAPPDVSFNLSMNCSASPHPATATAATVGRNVGIVIPRPQLVSYQAQ